MIYRPQFAFPPAPRGYRDEQFHYGFDGTNVAALGRTVAAGGQLNNILLPLEPDAGFLCRGIKIQTATARTNLGVQLKSPHGDYLEITYLPAADLYTPSGAAILGSLFVPLEPEVECPPGGVWNLSLYNPTAGGLACPSVTLYGVKRRWCGAEAA